MKGSYRELPFTVTWKAGSKTIEADDPAVNVYAEVAPQCQQTGVQCPKCPNPRQFCPAPFRLVSVDGTIEAEGSVAAKSPRGPSLKWKNVPKNESPADVAGLRIYVPDGVVPVATTRLNDTVRDQMERKGIDQWDITATGDFLLDTGHALLYTTSLSREKVYDVKKVRNEVWGHSVGGTISEGVYQGSCEVRAGICNHRLQR